jgi:glycosyltransferase involved in cell wall biosynthesis
MGNVIFCGQIDSKSYEKLLSVKFMRFVFVSNYLNHHQKPFCEEMFQRLGTNFVFISTSAMSEERKKLGYLQDETSPYVHLAYADETQRFEALRLINEADVVIAGAAPNDMLLERIRSGKLLFRYEERPYKKKPSFFKKIYHFVHWRKRDLWKKNIYMLCASAYTAVDYASLGIYKNRSYKWGYFPEIKKYDIDDLFSRKIQNTLIWCGRFIDWKHPDDAIIIAQKLKRSGYNFHLNMVGTGEMEGELKRMTEEYGLSDSVHFLGSMPPERVRAYMENAGIYLFTSDRQEGWGAVLN